MVQNSANLTIREVHSPQYTIMKKELLQQLGINTDVDIDAKELMHVLAFPQEYGISDHSEKKIEHLLKFINDYNEEKEPLSGESIITPGQAASIMWPTLRYLPTEEVWIVLLNSTNIPLRKQKMAQGDMNQTIIPTREILRTALIERATAIILYHNHPSGNPTPSKADMKETEKLHKACENLGINLLDHIIIANDKAYSFSEEKTITLFV